MNVYFGGQAAPDTLIAYFNYSSSLCGSLFNFHDLSVCNYPIATWQWNFGDINSGAQNTSALQHPTHDFSGPGLYTVTLIVTNSNNVSDTFYHNVQVLPISFSVFTSPGDTTICDAITIPISASGGTSYTWSPPSGLSNTMVSNPLASPSTSTQYTVTASDINGCTATAVLNIQVLPKPIVNLGPDTAICRGDYFVLNVERPNATYLWQDFSTQPSFPVNDFGVYWVEVTEGNCTNRDEIVVSNSILCDCSLIMPNAFSPNGDWINDAFKPLNLHEKQLIQFSIFNRWGDVLYTASPFTDGWDGKYKGQPCDLGTYFYLIRYSCLSDGKVRSLSGDLHLLR